MSRIYRPALLLAAFALLATAAVPQVTHAQLLGKAEAKCNSTLNGNGGKLISTVVGIQAKCLIANPVGSCPDAKGDAKIAKALGKLTAGAEKSCTSTCSLSDQVVCIDDSGCPPTGASFNSVQSCSAGGKKPMRASRMGFPGSACDTVNSAADMADCTAAVANQINDEIVAQIFGGLDGSDVGSDKDAGKCLSKVAATLGKSVGKITKSIGKCRGAIDTSAGATFSANDCSTADPKVANSIDKTVTKLRDTVAKSCTSATLGSLNICGGLTDIGEVQDCLETLLLEASFTRVPVAQRTYLTAGLINAAYPSSLQPTCGDNLVNQSRNQFAPMGEECDGEDDAACPGLCAPPGDRFECTCPNVPRTARIINPGDFVDLDSGDSGNAHDSTLPTPFIQYMELSNCACNEFDPVDQATCIEGAPTDPICDSVAVTEPRCSFATDLADPSCDQFGDNGGTNDDVDCRACDAFTTTPGAACQAQSGCQSQCYADTDADGDTPLGNCSTQGDCGSGQVCRGLCASNECVKLANGAPLPLAAASTRVCVVNFYSTDITGTVNLVTGEHEGSLILSSQVFQASTFITPCPTCGGYCNDDSGSWSGENCAGTCSTTKACVGGDTPGAGCSANADCPGGTDADTAQCWGVPCRFDDDCPGAETCTTASPTCAIQNSDGTCNLNLVCSGGDAEGQECRIEATHNVFGTTSGDCPPTQSTSITPGGFAIIFDEVTSEPTTWPVADAAPCDGLLSNYDCQCNHIIRGAGGTPNRPNNCWSTCNAVGPQFGEACAPGSGSKGSRCAGGDYDGLLCDEESDCLPDGSCSAGNPLHCVGGANEGIQCTGGGDCPDGTCEDACTGGLCVPQCLPGADPEEGFCPDGPSVAACDGDGFQWLGCGEENVGTTVGCDDAFPGSGTCVELPRRCQLLDTPLEGGDTANGNGDPTNFLSVSAFCVPATSGGGVNSATGLPGASKVRQAGTTEVNFTSIP